MSDEFAREIRVREATRADVPRLVELNRVAYPVLADENVVWGERHLLSHQARLPARATGS